MTAEWIDQLEHGSPEEQRRAFQVLLLTVPRDLYEGMVRFRDDEVLLRGIAVFLRTKSIMSGEGRTE